MSHFALSAGSGCGNKQRRRSLCRPTGRAFLHLGAQKEMRKEAREPAGGFLEGSQAWMMGKRVSPPPPDPGAILSFPTTACGQSRPHLHACLPSGWPAPSSAAPGPPAGSAASAASLRLAGLCSTPKGGPPGCLGLCWQPCCPSRDAWPCAGGGQSQRGSLSRSHLQLGGGEDEGAEGWPVQQYGEPLDKFRDPRAIHPSKETEKPPLHSP